MALDVAVPFPVEAPYQVKADLKRVDEDVFSNKLIVRDALARQYLSAKLVALANPALSAWLVQDSATESKVITAILNTIATVSPDLIIPIHAHAWQFLDLGLQCDLAGELHVNRLLDTIEARCVQWLLLQNKAHRLWHCLALSLQEDFALMHQSDRGFTAEALHVCFPSGWSPQIKFMQDLGQIHGPVADGDRLRASTKPLAGAMVSKGPFVRYVWTLCGSDHLSEHPVLKAQRADKYQSPEYKSLEPRRERPESESEPEDNQLNLPTVFFRCERQITIPLAAYARSLFLIRVFVKPLENVLHSQERAALMSAAIESMSPASKQYKSIEHLVNPALTICRNRLNNQRTV